MFPFSDLNAAISAANDAPDKELAYQNSLRDMYKKDAELPYAGQRAQADVRHLNAGASISEQMAAETAFRNNQTGYNQRQLGFMQNQMLGTMGQADSSAAKGTTDKLALQEYMKTMDTDTQRKLLENTNAISGQVNAQIAAHLIKAQNMPLQQRADYLHTVGQQLMDQYTANLPADRREQQAQIFKQEIDRAVQDPVAALKELKDSNYTLGDVGGDYQPHEWTLRRGNEFGLKGHQVTANKERSANIAQLAHNSAIAAGYSPGTEKYNEAVTEFIRNASAGSMGGSLVIPGQGGKPDRPVINTPKTPPASGNNDPLGIRH